MENASTLTMPAPSTATSVVGLPARAEGRPDQEASVPESGPMSRAKGGGKGAPSGAAYVGYLGSDGRSYLGRYAGRYAGSYLRGSFDKLLKTTPRSTPGPFDCLWLSLLFCLVSAVGIEPTTY